jgi:uncharacterized protein YcbK (DUF882 family)
MNLTRSFSLAELTFSQEATRSGLSNHPSEAHQANLRALCERVLQPLRDHLRQPVVVTSGYRTPTLNKRIGGARGSQHTRGEAADIYVPGMSVAVLMDKIQSLHLPIDQLIDEHGRWVHVSHTEQPRREVLKARIESGRTVYSPIKE